MPHYSAHEILNYKNLTTKIKNYKKNLNYKNLVFPNYAADGCFP